MCCGRVRGLTGAAGLCGPLGASGGRPERGFSPLTPKFERSTKTRNRKTFRTGQTHQPRQAEGT
eukprot:COSAG06_NODE_26251_length_618_cov_2.597303_1_plen_63_part_01